MQSRDTPGAVTPHADYAARSDPVALRANSAPSIAGTHLHLFRSEVLAERQTQWLGTVLLTPRRSTYVFGLFALLATAAVLALLFLADFTRTARVSGWLQPEEGVVRVFAPRPGVVTTVHASEGAQVHQGAPLLTLSDEAQSAARGATQEQIALRLAERRQSLLQESRQRAALLGQQQRALRERIDALRDEEENIAHEIALLNSRVKIAERAEALHQRLAQEGFISDMRLQQVESETIEHRARAGALERNRITIQRERMALESELRDLPLKTRNEIALVERGVAELEQELAEAEARREIVVPAPQDGTVTAIVAVPGWYANVSVPLLSIVPSDAPLEAHLYSPSRAIGFVSAGQRVRLRYQAYPYQKFGQYEGTVKNVSRSAISPAEVPPQLSGVVSLSGAAGMQATISEPVYRITVGLEEQSVTAYGKQVPLQAGMLVEADVALENRRLYEWVLDPLYTLTGRWQ